MLNAPPESTSSTGILHGTQQEAEGGWIGGGRVGGGTASGRGALAL